MKTSPPLSNKHMLPEQFIDRLGALYGVVSQDIIASFSEPRRISVRVNTIVSSDDEVLKAFSSINAACTPIKGIEHAYTVESTSMRTITDMPAYLNGAFYIQNASSMLPAVILGAVAGDTVLDIAAAPGSKTTHIAALMENKGRIVANDVSRDRLYKLEANLKRCGVKNCTTLNVRAETLWHQYPEYFDKTLVDAPCSMEGTFRSDDPDTYEGWSTKHIKRLSSQQKWMLRAAISATKPGGVIVYSTCTLAPEENEEVIDWILTKEKGKVEIDPIEIDLVPSTPACSSWRSKKYNHDLTGALRIIPGAIFEGFFVARLKKIASTVPSSLRSV